MSTAPVPRSAASVYPPSSVGGSTQPQATDSFYLRPMSEAGEVGDFSSSSAPYHPDSNRTSSFSAFDPPAAAAASSSQRRPSLPFETRDDNDRRGTVATSVGSMYPDESAASQAGRQDSTYSLGDSYFDLEDERRRTGLAMGSPADMVAFKQAEQARHEKGYF